MSSNKPRGQALRTEADIGLRVLALYYSFISMNEEFSKDLHRLSQLMRKMPRRQWPLVSREIRTEFASCAKRWSLPSDLGERDLWEAAQTGRKRLVPSLGGASNRRVLRRPRIMQILIDIDLIWGDVEVTASIGDTRTYSDATSAFSDLLRVVSAARKNLSKQGLKPLPFRYRSAGELRRIADVLYRACVLKQAPVQIASSLGGARRVRSIIQRWCAVLEIPRPLWPKGRPKKRSFTRES
jgi:hypothetical protein